MDYSKLNDFLKNKDRKGFVVKHDASIHDSVPKNNNTFKGTSTKSPTGTSTKSPTGTSTKSPTGTSTKAPATSTTPTKSDEVIHVELDPDLKEYIRSKLNKKKYMNYEQSLGCNIGISPTLFSSLTGGLSKEDII